MKSLRSYASKRIRTLLSGILFFWLDAISIFYTRAAPLLLLSGSNLYRTGPHPSTFTQSPRSVAAG